MYVVNGSDGRCLVAVRLIVGVRYLERPLREVLLYHVKFFSVNFSYENIFIRIFFHENLFDEN